MNEHLSHDKFRILSRRALWVTLILFILSLSVVVPLYAMPADPPRPQPIPLNATNPAANLWACLNGPLGNQPCDAVHGGSTDHGWDLTGNLAAGGDSAYYEGDTVPWRIEVSQMDPNATYVLTFTYSFVQGNAYTWDYPRIWNATVIANGSGGGNPCTGLPSPLGTSCAPTFTFSIPADPKFRPAEPTCPSSPPGNSAYQQIVENMYGFGPITITNMTYISTTTYPRPPCIIPTGNNDQFVSVTFNTGAANHTCAGSTPCVNAALVFGLHTSKPADWCTPPAPACTASTLGGGQSSAYHAALVSWYETVGPNVGNPAGLQTNQRQMKIGAAPTEVRLSKFGVLEVVPARVTLAWTTASQVNTAGFNLYRGENPEGPFVRINPQLIASSPDSLLGGKYQYQDTNVTPGKTYYYQLEDVEHTGTSTRHPSVSITVTPEQWAMSSSLPIVLGLSMGAAAVIAGGLFLTLKKLNVW